ncbi:hypothetical protein [Pontibacter oryzae]|uniref:Lipoprotein n=1 Tax=Pontibacter oryzae TaxID=2304593 RepID=A0A399SI96_9BACT|nr:hypothetical protein [Pontibacter oryzae]RIJ41587.1 hypothetical protein D1627_06025 [Pontibacter oryzae]
MLFYLKKRLNALAVLLCTLLGACNTIAEITPKAAEPGIVDLAVVYTIAKGGHYSDKNTYKQLNATSLKFQVLFDSSAVYTSKSPNNQGDINKLYGFSDCGSFHHVNSARFGWRWYNNRLELLGYTYVNKQVKYELITEVAIGESILCELNVEEEQYRFTVGEKEVVLPRACSGSVNGYQLYPYFGGDETAPHEIKIKIAEVD